MALINLSSYKQDIITLIIQSDNVVRGIDSHHSGYDEDSPDSLLYTNIFPFDFTPDVKTTSETYLLIEAGVSSPSKANDYFNNVQVTITILCHQDHMKMREVQGTRADYLAYELTKIFDGSLKFGFGGLQLVSNLPGILDENYKYRRLTFKNLDAKESRYYIKSHEN